MASQAQIDANRRNAQKSTGPRTPEGKERTSRNGLLHGLTAEKHFLPDEDPADFEALRARFRADWQPLTGIEESLVERMASAHWRLRRFAGMEAGIFNLSFETNPMPERYNQQGRSDPRTWAFNISCTWGDKFLKLARYESHLQREVSRCLRELQKIRADRRAEKEAAGIIFELEPRPEVGAHEDPPDSPPPPAAQDRSPVSENCEANPISNGAGRPAGPRRFPSGSPQGKNPLEFWGPPLRWSDFATEAKQSDGKNPAKDPSPGPADPPPTEPRA
jgi:hypothetical protein